MKNIPYYGPVTLPAIDRKRLNPDFDESLMGAESAIPGTVNGWDDPQQENRTDRSGDKWAYVAAAIQRERAVASAARARKRRLGFSAAGIVALAAILVALQYFLH